MKILIQLADAVATAHNSGSYSGGQDAVAALVAVARIAELKLQVVAIDAARALQMTTALPAPPVIVL